MSRIDVPFLVVGAGPVGMIEAVLLSKLGRECLVVERRHRSADGAGRARRERAHLRDLPSGGPRHAGHRRRSARTRRTRVTFAS